MKIAINTRSLIPNKIEGIGRFTASIFEQMVLNHPEHEFIFIFDRPYSEEFVFGSNVTPIVLSPKARHPVLYYFWYQHRLKKLLKKCSPDVFVSPDGMFPLKSKVKTISVIHDINFYHHPEFFPAILLKYYTCFFPKFAQKANKIVTVSEFCKEDIVKAYKIDPGKITVVYNGASSKFKPSDTDRITITQQKVSGGAPYFLFVGGLYHRKNLINLAKGFEIFKSKEKSNFKLIIAGQIVSDSKALIQHIESSDHKNDIKLIGRIAQDEELIDIISSCYAYTHVSSFEGFGIPVLEAIQCGVPVITSNISSLPEVAGKAALYADPDSVDNIADQMSKLARDPSLRSQLIAQGKKQQEKFNWKDESEKLWSLIQTVISE